MGRFFRESSQQGVNRSEQEVGAVAPRNPGECSCQAGNRMTAHGQENHGTQGHQQNVPDLAGGVGKHACQHDHERQRSPGSRDHQQPEAGTDQSTTLCDTDPQ